MEAAKVCYVRQWSRHRAESRLVYVCAHHMLCLACLSSLAGAHTLSPGRGAQHRYVLHVHPCCTAASMHIFPSAGDVPELKGEATVR